MSSPLFLEVDPQDRALILKTFPSATLVEGVKEGTELIECCQSAEIVCCFIYSRFTAEVIASLPKLRLLCTRSVGFNHIDIDACVARGITVCNVPDYGSHVIAEHVFALLLTALRHISEADQKVEKGNFDYHGLRGMALQGKTIGIIGTGKIGMNTAKIAHGFGMRILAVDKCRVLELEKLYGVQYVDLSTALQESDILSLHVPALPTTVHMINDASIRFMKKGIIIVNTARGELIDSEALLRGLRSGIVARALLDVLEHEKDFELNKDLIEHPRVIVTPHIAFYADDSMYRMYMESFTSIQQYSAGLMMTHRVSVPTIVCDLPGVDASQAKKKQ